MARKMTEDDLDALIRRVKWLLVGVVALFLLPLIVYSFYMERRLEVFESTLSYSSPEQLAGEENTRGDLYHLDANPVEGQIVYVPAYSHVYHDKAKPHLLTITLSVRNTSMDSQIVVKSMRYYDTKGKLVKSYLDKAVRLPALGTTEIVIAKDDTSGGSGANFLVEWYADKPVTEPIIEAVMIDTASQQGISFVRRGSVISEVIPSGDNSSQTLQ